MAHGEWIAPGMSSRVTVKTVTWENQDGKQVERETEAGTLAWALERYGGNGYYKSNGTKWLLQTIIDCSMREHGKFRDINRQ